MGRTGSKNSGSTRGVVSAKEGRLAALWDTFFGNRNSSTSSGNNAGYVYQSARPSVNLERLHQAGYERANQLLYDNPELRNSATVMLQNGAIDQRPNPDLSINDARERVAADIMMGRKPNLYEQGLATGAILTREEQTVAQRALRNAIASAFVTTGTFDVIPPVPSDLLRRAAGLSANVPTDVKLKAKSFQTQQIPNRQNQPNQQNQQNQQRQPNQSDNNPNRPFNSGRFRRSGNSRDWMNSRYDRNDATARTAVNNIVNNGRSRDDIINRLASDPNTRMNRTQAAEFADTLESA